MSGDERILVLTTGGTIDKVYFDARSEFEVGDSVVGDLLAQAHVTAAYDIRELMRKDSLELTDDDRAHIRMAFAAVQTLGSGVYIVMNGQIFDGARVEKDRSLGRFVATGRPAP